ncbi:HlyC/CorC family transporter [Spiribacter roseus]|uniref:HlyC/CorC family transporter n=1 Tax=Spiribacter roseus TaxID=1855875 RepID=UPI00083FB102|nr:HlyC/CorC family transporter [Spiribacter roseus]AUB78765.1 magnesium/cobalt efflux protein [Spiribacter roseus]KAF0284324.1 magnesium/cobalt efflux protein [Spiribacter roseus]PZA00202.1 HlyC/CorC family transporter [Gammaproteobacteria bacterium 2W06]
MDVVPLPVLFVILGALIVLSGGFSSSETALMTLNRYRLRHLSRHGNRGARRAERLLERPDRLIGIILLGNNFVNIFASSIATLIALRLGGQGAIAAATGLLTLTILIFAEVAPKTLAALRPERVAFPAAFVLGPLLKLLYPLVWLTNMLANTLLRSLGVNPTEGGQTALSREELRTVVNETGAMIPRRHQRMLLGILDLDQATVDDIMIPRNEVVGIDLGDDWSRITEQIASSEYTRLPVFEGGVDTIRGILHVRRVLTAMLDGVLTRERLLEHVREPYFVPEGTPLHQQMLNFQSERRRIGLIVDEYGEFHGLVTLEDILEEIVGEFTTDPAEAIRDIHRQPDGSYLAAGSASVRELKRLLGWDLPAEGPKTLNGLILEQLETIPEPGISLLIDGHPVTVLQAEENRVKVARLEQRVRPRETPPAIED